MWVAFVIETATHIVFRKNISVNAIFYDQSFNYTLTNKLFSFEQQGPDNHCRANSVAFEKTAL